MHGLRGATRAWTRRWAAIAVLCSLAPSRPIALGPHRPEARAARATEKGRADDTGQLWMEMRNVDLHIDEQHLMHMRSLRGEILATTSGQVPVLDDTKSFRIRATGGTVALDGPAIETLLNTVTFNYPDAPIKHLRIRIENGSLLQNGVLHKGVDIPFEMQAKPVVDPDGRIRLHPDKLRIFSVNGLALMRALGLHLASLMDLSKARGAAVKGNDLFIDPLKLIPAPLVDGRLATARVEGPLLVQEFVRSPEDTIFGTYVQPDSGAHNFVYFRGGALRFGKLTMSDTDLLINDLDERDPLDLDLTQYNRQLVAGYSKTLANFGIRAWLVDYHSLGRPVAAR